MTDQVDMSFPSIYRMLAPAILVAFCSCDQADRYGRTTERDSGGIRIVENVVALRDLTYPRVVTSEPLVEIASDALHQVVYVSMLASGNIVVGNGGEMEFLEYADDGTLLTRYGNEGAGPGEFRGLDRVVRGPGDSIVVFDYLNQRVSVLSPNGRFARSSTPPRLPDGGAALVEGVFDDGSMLVTPLSGPPSGQGLVRQRRQLWKWDPLNGNTTLLITIPQYEYFFFSQVPTPIAWRRPFFGQSAHYAVDRDRLIWGTTDSLVVRVLSSDGGMVALYRHQVQPTSFDAGDVRFLVDQSVDAYANEAARPALRRSLQELPRQGPVPAWGWPDYIRPMGPPLLVDIARNIWIAEYSPPGSASDNARYVYAPNGAYLGRIVLPPDFALLYAGPTTLAGVWRDEHDVEYVRVYGLRNSVSMPIPNKRNAPPSLGYDNP